MRGGTEGRPENNTRERIIDAAMQAFAQRGFEGATTKEIARLAKVNEVTLFRLFKSKRALFGAIMTERSPLLRITRELSFGTRGTIDDQIYGNIRTVLGILRENRQLFMVALGGAWRYPKAREIINILGVQKGIDLVSDFLASQMEAGRIRKGDSKVSARALMGMVQAYFITVDLMGGMSVSAAEEEKILRGFTSIFLDGMRAGGGGGSNER